MEATFEGEVFPGSEDIKLGSIFLNFQYVQILLILPD